MYDPLPLSERYLEQLGAHIDAGGALSHRNGVDLYNELMRVKDAALRNEKAAQNIAEENSRLRDRLEHAFGFTMPEIIEIGKAVLPHLSSETTSEIGAISYDVAATVTRIMRARAASIQSPSRPNPPTTA